MAPLMAQNSQTQIITLFEKVVERESNTFFFCKDSCWFEMLPLGLLEELKKELLVFP